MFRPVDVCYMPKSRKDENKPYVCTMPKPRPFDPVKPREPKVEVMPRLGK